MESRLRPGRDLLTRPGPHIPLETLFATLIAVVANDLKPLAVDALAGPLSEPGRPDGNEAKTSNTTQIRSSSVSWSHDEEGVSVTLHAAVSSELRSQMELFISNAYRAQGYLQDSTSYKLPPTRALRAAVVTNDRAQLVGCAYLTVGSLVRLPGWDLRWHPLLPRPPLESCAEFCGLVLTGLPPAQRRSALVRTIGALWHASVNDSLAEHFIISVDRRLARMLNVLFGRVYLQVGPWQRHSPYLDEVAPFLGELALFGPIHQAHNPGGLEYVERTCGTATFEAR